MPTASGPEWQHLALYALAAAVVLMLLQRLPFVGKIIRLSVSLGLLAFAFYLLIQQAPYEPHLARVSERLGIDGQQVTGKEVRIRMSADGHFWANVTLNGVKRRMLIDSGATVTALSDTTAREAGVDAGTGLVPVVLQTAGGLVRARTGTVEELRVGNVLARNLNVVVAPGLGSLEVLGMNFLSELASWRVEGRTLILVPHHPQGAGTATAAH
jgi:aspartyl protease family protein